MNAMVNRINKLALSEDTTTISVQAATDLKATKSNSLIQLERRITSKRIIARARQQRAKAQAAFDDISDADIDL